MPEFTREPVGRLCIGRWSGGDRSAALRHKLILGMIGAMLGALLQGCTADKQPSKAETGLADAAKDVVIPLEAGKMKNPFPESDEVVSQGDPKCFLGLAPNATILMGAETPASGAACTRLPWTLTSAHVQHWSDGELFWIIRNGVRLTGMPSWQSSISENDSWKLVRVIHNLPQATLASRSWSLFTDITCTGFVTGQVHPEKCRTASRSLRLGDTKAGR